MATEEDARQRANDERTKQHPIDRSQKPVADARDQGQRHGMGNGLSAGGNRIRTIVPLGRIGAFNPAWIAFGRRLGLRIEHAISIDGNRR
jgi:hypothetical protein